MRLDQRRKSPLTQQIHKLKLSNTNTRKSILAGPGYYSGGNASRISGSLLKEKTRDLVGRLQQALEAKRLGSIPTELIEISDLSADERTLFFTNLIRKMEGYSLRDVTNVKVHHGLAATETTDEDVDADEEDE